MVIQHKTYTNEEFWEFAQRPENQNKRLELIDGMIHEKGGDANMAPSGKINTIIAARILHFLSAFVIQHDLGYVVGADSGFDLGPGIIRQPDTGFIVKERVTDLDGNTFAGAPDLAVAVISPSEKPRQVIDKARMYLNNGGKLVWTVYPEDKVVDVYRLNAQNSLLIDSLTLRSGSRSGSCVKIFHHRVAHENNSCI